MPPLFTNAIFCAAIVGFAGYSGSLAHASPQTADAGDRENLFHDAAELDESEADTGFDSVETDVVAEDIPFDLPSDDGDVEIDESNVNDLIHHPEGDDFNDDEPVRGDFDRDGILDLTKDLRLLRDQIESDTPDLSYDLDGDGQVAASDTTFWVERIRGRLVGDLNLDNRVDSTDFVDAHKFAKFKTGEEADWRMGDVNGDRVFDSLDEKIIHMSGNYEAKRSPRRSAVSSVPEPILLSLVGMGLVFLLLAYTALQGQRQQNQSAKN